MSWKATAVSGLYAPKTQKGYFIMIPKIFHSVILASRADYPKPPLNTAKLSIFANDVVIPLRAKTDNVFSVTIPEGSYSEIEFEIDSLLAKQANYGYKNGNRLSTFNIFVCPYLGTPPPGFEETLQSINGMEDAVKVIDSIKNIAGVLLNDGVPLVTEWRTLRGCTLVECQPDGFNSSGRNAVQNWNLKFHYTYMNPLIKFPIVGKTLAKEDVDRTTEAESAGGTVEKVTVDTTGNSGLMWNGPIFTQTDTTFEAKKAEEGSIKGSRMYSGSKSSIV